MRLTLLLICFAVSHYALTQPVQTFGMGQTKDVNVTASSNAANGINTLRADGFLPNHNAASRFLSQATLGARFSEINNLVTTGEEQWLNTQLNLPNSFSIEGYIRSLAQTIADSLNRTYQPEPYTVQNLNLSDYMFDVAWFQGSMTAPDRLRWRVAFALSEIFVVSRVSAFDGNPYALASYYDMLLKNSLGNYRTLLQDMTYHPTMGVYLTFLNNKAEQTIIRGSDTTQTFPDENYAREIMQLFSIGLYELNADGTEKLDVNGQPIPTYTNDDIAGLARVFTGLSWHDVEYIGQRNDSEQDYTHPMKFFPLDSSEFKKGWWQPTIYNAHEPGPKTFLNHTIPARPAIQGEQDISEALDVLFNHPNTAPFICRRLIQRLITSNPSPEYIGRISAVFVNNGSGVRGDLGAVVKAILLDPEAQVVGYQKERFAGKLKEPFIRYTNLVNALNLSSTTGALRNRMSEVYDRMEQRPLNSPSVFNFYQPDYVPDGPLRESGKFGPEFQLLNSITLTGYLNALDEWLVHDDPIDYPWYPGDNAYKPAEEPGFDLTADYPFASNKNLPILLDKYNMILTHGLIGENNLAHIKTAIENMPEIYNSNGQIDETDAQRRIRLAIFLMMSSPEYLINK